MMNGEDIQPMALKPGGLVEVRADVDGMTKSFIIQADRFEFGEDGDTLLLEGTVQAQGAARQIDQRLQNQRNSIDVLTKHVEFHHSVGDIMRGCDFKWDPTND